MITRGRTLSASAFPAKTLVRESASCSWLSFLGVRLFSPQAICQFALSAPLMHFYLVSVYNWDEMCS